MAIVLCIFRLLLILERFSQKAVHAKAWFVRYGSTKKIRYRNYGAGSVIPEIIWCDFFLSDLGTYGLVHCSYMAYCHCIKCVIGMQ